MAKKTKSLSQWCLEKMWGDILSELDSEKNLENYSSGYIPDRMAVWNVRR